MYLHLELQLSVYNSRLLLFGIYCIVVCLTYSTQYAELQMHLFKGWIIHVDLYLSAPAARQATALGHRRDMIVTAQRR